MNKIEFDIALAKSQKSKVQLMKDIGMPPNSFYRKYKGEQKFKADEIIAICDALNVTDASDKVHIFLT